MVDLVKYIKSGLYTDSYIIAEKFGKKHEYVLKRIDALKERLVRHKFAPKIKTEIVEKHKEYRGQEFRYFILNKKAFSLLIMNFKGDKAFEWQEKFYDAFAIMEQALLNKSNQEWITERQQGKQIRLELTDSIKDFVDYAISQGSRSSKTYYSNITKMEYKALGLIEKNEKVSRNFRDTLNMMQLHQLIVAEHVAEKSLSEGMSQKLHYKDIYQLAKTNVIKLAETMFIKKIS